MESILPQSLMMRIPMSSSNSLQYSEHDFTLNEKSEIQYGKSEIQMVFFEVFIYHGLGFWVGQMIAFIR